LLTNTRAGHARATTDLITYEYARGLRPRQHRQTKQPGSLTRPRLP